jgi:hypothetical protein
MCPPAEAQLLLPPLEKPKALAVEWGSLAGPTYFFAPPLAFLLLPLLAL